MYPLYVLPCLLLSGFTSDFWFDVCYITAAYILLYQSCSIPPLSCSRLIISCVFPTWYHLHISTCSYMLVLTTRFSMQFMIWIYRYTCVWSCTPFGISITTRWGVLTLLDPHVQVSEFGACRFSRMVINDAQLKRESTSRPSEALSFQAPCASLEFSFCKLVSAFCTVHTCISLCILAFVLIGDVIFLKYCVTSGDNFVNVLIC